MKKNYIITINRQYGSGGREIGRRLAERLNIPYYNKELLTMAAEKSGLCQDFIKKSLVDVPSNKFWYALALNPQALMVSSDNSYLTADMAKTALCEAVRHIADQGPCVIVGRYAGSILRDRDDVMRVFVSCDDEDRVEKIIKRDGLSAKAAASKMKRVDKERATYADLHFGEDWGKASTYDLCINSSKFGLDGAVEIIKTTLEQKSAENE